MAGLSVAAVLEHYGARISGDFAGWRSMRCPFHSDSTASARVNLDLGAFICLACGVKGDALKLIMKQENVNYRTAIEYAAKTFGADIEEISQPVYQRSQRRKRDGKGRPRLSAKARNREF